MVIFDFLLYERKFFRIIVMKLKFFVQKFYTYVCL